MGVLLCMVDQKLGGLLDHSRNFRMPLRQFTFGQSS